MPVRPPSLRSIAAFEAAARHASFTRAAAELNLTPGAVSHAIKALETRLDQRLFDREGRQVALTPAGQTLAARVRLSLNLLEDAFDVAPWRSFDRLTVSTTNAIAQKILLPYLPKLLEACQGADLDLRSSDALDDLDSGIDLAIRFGPGGWRGVQSRRLGKEVLFPVVSPQYRPGAWPRSEAELAEHVLIHHPESSWRLWLDPNIACSVLAGPGLYIDAAALVVDSAKAGYGIALGRGRLVRRDLESGELVRIFDRSVPAEYGYWAVWNASSSKQALIERLIDAVSELFMDEEHSISG